MSSRKGRVGKRQNKHGQSWHFVVDLDPDEDGKRRQEWRGGFKLEREATAALHRLIGEVDRGEYVEKSELTVGRFLRDKWLPAIRGVGLRPSTLSGYEVNVETHIIPKLGSVQLQRLTPDRLNAWYGELRQPREGRKQGLGPRTVRMNHVILQRALDDAVKWGYLQRNPAKLASPPSQKSTRSTAAQTWTADEARRFLAAARQERLYAAFVVMLTTGMRRGEMLGLTWRNVDLDRSVISIAETRVLVDNRLEQSTPKTDAGKRRVALDAGTVAALRDHRKAQAAERLLVGSAYGDEDLVFCDAAGVVIQPGTLRRTFHRIAKRAGVPRLRLHDLRHTYCTLALEQGVHPKVVQERVGHANVAITLGIYSHVSARLHEDAAAKVAGSFLDAP